MKQYSKPAKSVVQELSARLGNESVVKYIRDSVPSTLSNYMTPQRVAKMAIGMFSRTPALWKCSQDSLVRSIVECASLGLECTGGTYTQAYLVPYGQECQLIVSAQGLVDLARRAGIVQDVNASVVYERDQFSLRLGMDPTVEHVPYMGADDPGAITGAYCVATLRSKEDRASGNETKKLFWMPTREIEKRRLVSPTGKQNRGPWKDWYPEMCIKTCLKAAAKFWPKSIEMTDALEGMAHKEEGGTGIIIDAPPMLQGEEVKEPTISDKVKSYDEETGEVAQIEGYGVDDQEFNKDKE